ncbi:tRNA (adenosine(37)-N6)-threonylcarbamoyltransferase complex dimerization subunit type 1 TsaB [Natronoflexus pectinivorans]|uniref:tRNA threonylcarbamoyladenosine biosynthesis protein TsaB n=1 Tax=Natronoflexus pectinivorans TaxID=682526 RepID=A0A4R2GJE7_9BACT|nr:tRNA (adenosine(37)-N6)-threonylcarbamoyltransferase complex dimerization subunit type 1 TsaB [Natronoflexus pectinivorans]TCO08442.1 tRNA threonylcarbamoyladenosine biosynthesis protein TsaB [Natronoflexus pectinivorans]
MALILCIETSAVTCSVALSENGIAIARLREDIPNSHSARLTVLIEQLLKNQNLQIKDLDAVAVSSGPGSYTGLRIGVSVAKGLCFGASKPLISVPTLEILAAMVLHHQEFSDDTLICPMLDARRMEVYSALYNSRLERIRNTEAEIITEESYREHLDQSRIIFAGNGAVKCRGVIRHSNAIFPDDEVMPLAAEMASLAHQRFLDNKFESVAYFEPYYLKDFLVTVPKRKVF